MRQRAHGGCMTDTPIPSPQPTGVDPSTLVPDPMPPDPLLADVGKVLVGPDGLDPLTHSEPDGVTDVETGELPLEDFDLSEADLSGVDLPPADIPDDHV